jgi:hypothetical protein
MVSVCPVANAMLLLPLTLPVSVILPLVVLVVVSPAFKVMLPPVTEIGPAMLADELMVMFPVLVALPNVNPLTAELRLK